MWSLWHWLLAFTSLLPNALHLRTEFGTVLIRYRDALRATVFRTVGVPVQQLKVLDAIVRSVVIGVVHMLVPRQWPSEVLFHNDSVLTPVAVVAQVDENVAIPNELTTLRACGQLVSRQELPRPSVPDGREFPATARALLRWQVQSLVVALDEARRRAIARGRRFRNQLLAPALAGSLRGMPA